MVSTIDLFDVGQADWFSDQFAFGPAQQEPEGQAAATTDATQKPAEMNTVESAKMAQRKAMMAQYGFTD